METVIAKELNLAGKQFGGYKILSELGRGGMAIVYKADESSLNRVVALKVMSPKISQDEEMIKRFQREAQAAARLSHPNIVHIYSIGECEGIPYFAMEYVKGMTLRQMRKQGPIRRAKAISIMMDVARALDEAHKAGLVHRDIKPGNIMIDSAGRVKVTDFGLAHVAEATTKLTVDGTFLGTPEYMSPEQCEGKGIDGRSDIYSLGVTFYEILTGQVPFKADTPASMLVKIMKGDRIPIRQADPTIPAAIETVVEKMMHVDKQKRYRNAEELLFVLRKLEEQFKAADNETLASVLQEIKKKKVHQMTLGVVAAFVAVLMAAGLLALRQISPGRMASPAAPAKSKAKRTSGVIAAGSVSATNVPPAEAGKDVVAAAKTAGDRAGANTREAATISPPKPEPVPQKETAAPSKETPAPPKESTPATPKESPALTKGTPAAVAMTTAEGPKTIVAVAPANPAAAVPPSNSVMVIIMGDNEKAALISTYVESGLPKERLQIVDADSVAGRRLAEVARYALNVTLTKVGTRQLQFYGSSEDLHTYVMTVKMVAADTGKVVAGPFSRKVEYTALNAEANLKEAADGLTRELRAALAK